MGINLLSAGEKFMEFGKNFVSFFTDFQILYAVEIVAFFALVYFVSKILRENDATKVMLAYWVLIAVGGVLCIVDDDLMTKGYFFCYLLMISAFMLIMFSMEVKKSLWDVHSAKERGYEKSQGGDVVRPQEDTERCIAAIIKALQNMSKNNVGALIVLSKGSLPKQVIQSGISIDAEISTQLIEGVFFPKAPLHDGAMVILGHKIQAAGCFLPLTQKTSYPKEFGTRHRAGIGITEVANVISLIVSEETGIISIVKQGNVTRYADYDALMDALKDYYWQDMPLSDKKRGGNAR